MPLFTSDLEITKKLLVTEPLREQAVAQTYTVFLEDMNKECTGTLHENSESVRQRDGISRKLHTPCLEGIYKKVNRKKAVIRVNGEYFSLLIFADDIVLFSVSEEDKDASGAVLRKLICRVQNKYE